MGGHNCLGSGERAGHKASEAAKPAVHTHTACIAPEGIAVGIRARGVVEAQLAATPQRAARRRE
eukprot:4560406-Prymnesium_polylepis.2